MAVEQFQLPMCDVCGEAWLPLQNEARQDPRKYDAKQRRDGLPPLRCGKCKSPNWDRNFTGDRRRKDPAATPLKAVPAPGASPVRCKHGLLHCPQCHIKKE